MKLYSSILFLPISLMLFLSGLAPETRPESARPSKIPPSKLIKIEGQVLSRNQMPISGIKIILPDHPDIAPGYSDAQGKFHLLIPDLATLEDIHLIAFDGSLSRLKLDYSIEKVNPSSFRLWLEAYPQSIQEVQLWDQDGQEASHQAIYIDGIPYESNEEGLVKIKHQASDLSLFQSPEMHIESGPLKSSPSELHLFLYPMDNPQLRNQLGLQNRGRRFHSSSSEDPSH